AAIRNDEARKGRKRCADPPGPARIPRLESEEQPPARRPVIFAVAVIRWKSARPASTTGPRGGTTPAAWPGLPLTGPFGSGPLGVRIAPPSGLDAVIAIHQRSAGPLLPRLRTEVADAMSCTRLGRRTHSPSSLATIALAATLVGSPARSDDRTVDTTPRDGPLAAANALKSFRVEPGLRVELVAAEPMVVSPVACAFDARGRLYVAE